MKKVLVVGSQGMAGHMIKNVLLDSKSYEIIDISRGVEINGPTYVMDLKDLNRLEYILQSEKPDVTVNCVGILNDAAEANPETSIFVNSYIPHFLAKHSKRLIHISTDCVFSGKEGDYKESSTKDATGYYAQSKSLGEVFYGPHLTMRTSIIGPELKTYGRGLLHWFLSQINHVNGYSAAIWSGVTTLQLAKGIIEYIEMPNVTGLIHYTNNQKISKFHLLEVINEVFNRGISITPKDDYQADKSLINTRKDVIITIPDYRAMINELYNFMVDHPELYSQYKI